MIKLTLLTLAGLFAVLTLYGEPGARTAPAAAAARTESQAAAPAASAVPEIVQVAVQTPERSNPFAGPALRPSPEHAGEAAAATADLAAPEGAVILYVTGNKVNFRAGPSRNDAVVGAILGGSPVEALGPTDGAWVHIRDAQGQQGYMSASFLSPNRPG